MATLISWLGDEDLNAANQFLEKSEAFDEKRIGPIAAICQDTALSIDKIKLLTTPDRSHEVVAEFLDNYAGLTPEITREQVKLKNPQDFASIFLAGRKSLEGIFQESDSERVYANITSGTRTMAAAWPLLKAATTPEQITLVQTSPESGVNKIRIPGTLFVEQTELVDTQRSRLGREKRIAYSFKDIVGEHPSFKKVTLEASVVSRLNVPVLILGETGTGKEVFAQAIHDDYIKGRSSDASAKMVALNCAAIPADLFEAEMFGTTKGAFTDAKKDRVGYFERAIGGTLFLDEVGELSLGNQSKLLRVIQERTLVRVGGSEEKDVSDVRIIAATNRNLEVAVEEGSFRADLLHRLNTFSFRLPALRERASDIPLLISYFVNKLSEEHDLPEIELKASAMKALISHYWPGNVRELEKTVLRMIVYADGRNDSEVSKSQALDSLDQALPGDQANLAMPGEDFDLKAYLRTEKERLILKAMEQADQNQSKAADLLGVPPQYVQRNVGNRS